MMEIIIKQVNFYTQRKDPHIFRGSFLYLI